MGAHSAISGRLVGRRRELEAFERSLAFIRAPAAGGRFVEIVGDPGIGKTRLLGELRRVARERSFLVLDGRSTARDRDLPFGLLIDALDDHLAGLGDGVAGTWRGPLASVFPALAGDGRAERYVLQRALGSLLCELAAPAGLVLTLDDVHWADPASAELIGYLIRRPPPGRVLLAVAYRPRQGPAPLVAALAEGAAEGVVERLEVGPLSAAETGDLLGSRAGPARRRALHCESGGNPFYLEALTKSPEGGDPGWTGDGLPRPVAAALRAELAALSEAAGLVARAAAVVGDPFDPGLVADAAGLAEEVVLATLDELVEGDLVRPDGAGRLLRFRHPLVCQATYRSAPIGWRLAAHARAAAALADRRAAPAVRAHHVVHSARTGDEAAIALLAEAAGESVSQAPGSAADWLRAALGLLPHNAPPAQRLELIAALGHALAMAGRLAESRAVWRDLLARLTSAPVRDRVAVVVSCALMERLLGQHAEARALLLDEIGRLRGRADWEAAVLGVEVASGLLVAGDFAADRPLLERSLQTARREGDRPLEAAAAGLLAVSAYSAGAVPEALSWIEAAGVVVDDLSDGQLATRLDTIAQLGWAEAFVERHHSALRRFARGLAVTSAGAHGHLLTYLLVGKAYSLQFLGRLDEAADCAEDGVEAALLSGSAELSTMASSIHCLVALQRGDLDEAAASGRRAVDAAGGDQDLWAAIAGCVLAETHLLRGDPARCLDEMLAAGGGDDLPRLDVLHRPFFLEILAAAAMIMGDAAAAKSWAEQTAACAHAAGLPTRTGHALLARTYVLLGAGDASGAAERARAAVRAFDTAGNPVAAGRAHLLAGMALSGVDVEQAVTELGQAKALFAGAGARGLYTEAVREQRRLGARKSRTRPQGAGLSTLTERERQIAELVTKGRTNRQIAETLFLSPKTVEAYLTRIFAKLGVTSRTGVAALLAAEPHQP